MQRSLKLVSIPGGIEDVDKIVEIMMKERSEHPMLVVLPEYFTTGQLEYLEQFDIGTEEQDNRVRDGDRAKALVLSGGSVSVESPEIGGVLEKLQSACRQTNAHLFFGALERMGESFSTSGFMITPSKKEPSMAVVRRKMGESPLGLGKKSLKSLNVHGFKVIPLLCADVTETPSQPKLSGAKADVLLISSHYLLGHPQSFRLSHLRNMVLGRKGAIVKADIHTHSGIYVEGGSASKKQHKSLEYSTHIITK
jgi:predicted amidohydrolase